MNSYKDRNRNSKIGIAERSSNWRQRYKNSRQS